MLAREGFSLFSLCATTLKNPFSFFFFFTEKYNEGNYGDAPKDPNVKDNEGEGEETGYGEEPKARPPSKEVVMEKIGALDKLGFSSSELSKIKQELVLLLADKVGLDPVLNHLLQIIPNDIKLFKFQLLLFFFLSFFLISTFFLLFSKREVMDYLDGMKPDDRFKKRFFLSLFFFSFSLD